MVSLSESLSLLLLWVVSISQSVPRLSTPAAEDSGTVTSLGVNRITNEASGTLTAYQFCAGPSSACGPPRSPLCTSDALISIGYLSMLFDILSQGALVYKTTAGVILSKALSKDNSLYSK